MFSPLREVDLRSLYGLSSLDDQNSKRIGHLLLLYLEPVGQKRGGSLKSSITRAFISHAQGNARGPTSAGIKLCSCRQLSSAAQGLLHMKMKTKGEQELHSLLMLGDLVVF